MIKISKHILHALLMLGSTVCYGLDPSSDSCEFFFSSESDSVNGDALELLEVVKPGEAVKVCTGSNGNRVYYVASAVSRKGGVSYFYLNRVFRAATSDGVRWDFVPPDDLLHMAVREVHMQVGNNTFKQNHEGFARVKGMSVGLFKALNRSWKNVLSSEDAFDEAVEWLTEFSSDTRKLKRTLYGGGDIPAILTASYVEGASSSSPHYRFSVANNSHMWDIEFDFVENVISFESVILISE